jgi:hypothetical protein
MSNALTGPPGSLPAELRRDLRRLGLKRASQEWALGQSTMLRLAAGLRVPRAAVARGLRKLLARFEGRDG